MGQGRSWKRDSYQGRSSGMPPTVPRRAIPRRLKSLGKVAFDLALKGRGLKPRPFKARSKACRIKSVQDQKRVFLRSLSSDALIRVLPKPYRCQTLQTPKLISGLQYGR